MKKAANPANKKIEYPDWKEFSGVQITRAEGRCSHPVWKPYAGDPWRLRLVATLEVVGGSILFEIFESKEAERAAWRESNRKAAWRTGLRFGEMLWHNNPFMEYAVLFRPRNHDACGLREAVCIYAVIPELTERQKSDRKTEETT